MIYFIKCGEFVKIGRARDPQERVAYLQTANPYEVSLIGAIDALDEEEARLHSAFAAYRHRGEWFFLSRTISDFVDSHCHRPTKRQKLDNPKKELDGNVISFADRNKERNLEVMRLSNAGKSARQIAATLGISDRQVNRIKLRYKDNDVIASSSSRDSTP